jgi:tripartite-type tricarboxylate transporter receptor subunit TctC
MEQMRMLVLYFIAGRMRRHVVHLLLGLDCVTAHLAFNLEHFNQKGRQAVKLLLRTVPRGQLLLSLVLGATPLHAQDAYPTRPITLIIPVSAGSQIDAIGRALADSIGRQAGQPVVVLNREGAGMALGMDAIAKARPDGYTVGFGSESPLSTLPHLKTGLPYKPVDFELVCRTNVANMAVVVGPESPFKSFDDLITAARKAPGKLNYGTAGIGTPPHLLIEAMASELGVQFSHVPFRAIGDMAVQTMNGSVQFTVTVPNMLAANGARGMRGLALTGDSGMAELPPMPLVRDIVGKNSPIASYGVGGLGIFAPKGLRPESLVWLRTACKSAAESAGFATASSRTLTPMRYADGADFLRDMQATSRVSAELVRKLNIKLD